MGIDHIQNQKLNINVIRTPKDQDKRLCLVQLLRSRAGSGIIYVANSHTADELRGYLLTQRIPVARYHKKMRVKDRRNVQEAFQQGRHRVLVATNGTAEKWLKPDIRFVVHYHLPESLERYVRQAMHAGRDGLPAVATLFYRLEDKKEQGLCLGGKYPDREETTCVYETVIELLKKTRKKLIPTSAVFRACGIGEDRARVVFSQLESAGMIRRGRGVKLLRVFTNDAELENALVEFEKEYTAGRERLEAMLRYAQSSECRWQVLTEYLQRYQTEGRLWEALAGDLGGEAGRKASSRKCGVCDNCAMPQLSGDKSELGMAQAA